MSRIFDALKRAQQARSEANSISRVAPPQAERRRSPRWSAHVPLFIYGHPTDASPFHEEAYSVSVSELGALLVMTATVRPGQTMLLSNKVTRAEQECRVIRISERDLQSIEVAVEFPHRAPAFWQLAARKSQAESGASEGDPIRDDHGK